MVHVRLWSENVWAPPLTRCVTLVGYELCSCSLSYNMGVSTYLTGTLSEDYANWFKQIDLTKNHAWWRWSSNKEILSTTIFFLYLTKKLYNLFFSIFSFKLSIFSPRIHFIDWLQTLSLMHSLYSGIQGYSSVPNSLTAVAEDSDRFKFHFWLNLPSESNLIAWPSVEPWK